MQAIGSHSRAFRSKHLPLPQAVTARVSSSPLLTSASTVEATVPIQLSLTHWPATDPPVRGAGYEPHAPSGVMEADGSKRGLVGSAGKHWCFSSLNLRYRSEFVMFAVVLLLFPSLPAPL
jgi:hypothetical protein